MTVNVNGILFNKEDGTVDSVRADLHAQLTYNLLGSPLAAEIYKQYQDLSVVVGEVSSTVKQFLAESQTLGHLEVKKFGPEPDNIDLTAVRLQASLNAQGQAHGQKVMNKILQDSSQVVQPASMPPGMAISH